MTPDDTRKALEVHRQDRIHRNGTRERRPQAGARHGSRTEECRRRQRTRRLNRTGEEPVKRGRTQGRVDREVIAEVREGQPEAEGIPESCHGVLEDPVNEFQQELWTAKQVR